MRDIRVPTLVFVNADLNLRRLELLQSSYTTGYQVSDLVGPSSLPLTRQLTNEAISSTRLRLLPVFCRTGLIFINNYKDSFLCKY